MDDFDTLTDSDWSTDSHGDWSSDSDWSTDSHNDWSTDDDWSTDSDWSTDNDTDWSGDNDWSTDSDAGVSWSDTYVAAPDVWVTPEVVADTGTVSADFQVGDVCGSVVYDSGASYNADTGRLAWTSGDDGDGIDTGVVISPCD